MPLLLADFIYNRDCKLNLRKSIDTTVAVQYNKSIDFSYIRTVFVYTKSIALYQWKGAIWKTKSTVRLRV